MPSKYPAVTSELRVHNVRSVEKEWIGKAAQSDDFCHTLIEIDLDDDRFFFVTDGLKLTATLSASHPVELEDVSLPTDRPKFTDLFTNVSRYHKWEHEIERLRG